MRNPWLWIPLIVFWRGARLLANEPTPCACVYGEVNYLLWFSNQDDLHSPTTATGKAPKLNTPWSSGVRAMVGGHPAPWNLELCYTYYATSARDTAKASIGTILSSTPSTAGIFKVDERWNLSFNRLDLQLGRQFILGNHCLLEPFLGVEGLDVFQKFDLNVNTIFLDLMTALPATNRANSKNKNAWLAIGPRIGFKANLEFKGGFGLYGHGAVNLLWGRCKIKQDYDQVDIYSSGSSTVLIDQTGTLSQQGSIFNADLEIGLNWKRLFPKPHLELTLKAGWEQHYYADIIRFQDFYLQQTSLGTAAYTTNGNLSLSGFSCGLLLSY